jgi:hypothetical protein
MGQIGAKGPVKRKAAASQSAANGSADKRPRALDDPIPF